MVYQIDKEYIINIDNDFSEWSDENHKKDAYERLEDIKCKLLEIKDYQSGLNVNKNRALVLLLEGPDSGKKWFVPLEWLESVKQLCDCPLEVILYKGCKNKEHY